MDANTLFSLALELGTQRQEVKSKMNVPQQQLRLEFDFLAGTSQHRRQFLDNVRKDLGRQGAICVFALALRSNGGRTTASGKSPSQLTAAYPTLGRAVALAGSNRAQLEGWLASARRSRLAPFRDLARTIKRHLDGLWAYTETRMTNGVLKAISGLLPLA